MAQSLAFYSLAFEPSAFDDAATSSAGASSGAVNVVGFGSALAITGVVQGVATVTGGVVDLQTYAGFDQGAFDQVGYRVFNANGQANGFALGQSSAAGGATAIMPTTGQASGSVQIVGSDNATTGQAQGYGSTIGTSNWCGTWLEPRNDNQQFYIVTFGPVPIAPVAVASAPFVTVRIASS